MQIDLTPEQNEFIRRALATGRLRRAEDAVTEALELWIEHEREREEILAAIDEAEASLARGEGVTIASGSSRELAEEVKSRGRERIGRNSQTPR